MENEMGEWGAICSVDDDGGLSGVAGAVGRLKRRGGDGDVGIRKALMDG